MQPKPGNFLIYVLAVGLTSAVALSLPGRYGLWFMVFLLLGFTLFHSQTVKSITGALNSEMSSFSKFEGG